MSLEAPKGLSLAGRRSWYEQAGAFEESGRLTPARLELLTAWARSLDARERALKAWQAVGSPQSETGSMGQERRHHLAVAFDKAEAQLATLSAKLERSAARREAKRPDGLPVDARRIEVEGQEDVVVDGDGRLLMLGVVTGRWQLAWDEVEWDAGARLRWVDGAGVPRFHEVPPWRLPGDGGRAAPLPWPELEDWAARVGVPIEAVQEWHARSRRAPSRVTYRGDQTLDDMLGGV